MSDLKFWLLWIDSYISTPRHSTANRAFQTGLHTLLGFSTLVRVSESESLPLWVAIGF